MGRQRNVNLVKFLSVARATASAPAFVIVGIVGISGISNAGAGIRHCLDMSKSSEGKCDSF